MSSESSSSARKRAKPSSNEDQYVYVTKMSTEGEFSGEETGGTFTNKYAANIALLKHDGILNGNQYVDELEISYDEDDLIQVVGTIGEGEQVNWRVEKYPIKREVRSAEECDEFAAALAEEMGATYVPRENDSKRHKTEDSEDEEDDENSEDNEDNEDNEGSEDDED